MNTTTEILIIEDDIVAASLLKKTLIDLGHTVVGTAASGKKALEIARKKKPQLMMVDFELEDNMTGAEVTKEILQEQSLASIFITSKSDSKTLKSISETNPHGYILKPFNRKEIGMIIDTVVKKFNEEKERTAENQELGRTVEMTHEELKNSLLELKKEVELRKLAEKELNQALTREREFNSIKSKIARNISSEFMTPLTSLLSSTEIIKLKLNGSTDEQTKKHLERISESTLLLKDVLSNVQFLENNSDQPSSSPSIVNLKSLVEQVIGDIRNDTEYCPIIKLNTLITSEETEVYSELLKKILYNLLSNAVKYSMNKAVAVNLVEKNHKLQIEIVDHGLGIPQQDQEHIFEHFFRSDNVRQIKGRGMGLSIAKNLATLLEAELSFESQEGVGTKFSLILP